MCIINNADYASDTSKATTTNNFVASLYFKLFSRVLASFRPPLLAALPPCFVQSLLILEVLEVVHNTGLLSAQ